MFFPILFVKGADDDTMARTGMYEFTVFQVDTYMGRSFLFSSVMEENKIPFFKFTLLDLSAIFLALVIRISFKVLAIYFFINGRT